MKMKECFKNATEIVISGYGYKHKLTYVEGFAVSGKMLEIGLVFPVQHAWAVDTDGNVYDPTFEQPEHGVYIGLPIPNELHQTMLIKTRHYGVFYIEEMLNVKFFETYLDEVAID